jgi:hypothetical protein
MITALRTRAEGIKMKKSDYEKVIDQIAQVCGDAQLTHLDVVKKIIFIIDMVRMMQKNGK